MIITYSGSIPEEYEEIMVRLFEQIHARNVAKVDEIFIEILERILNKYPTLLDENSPELKSDIEAIESLAFEFNIGYLHWVHEMGIEKEDTNPGIWDEDSSCLYGNLSRSHTAGGLVSDIRRYLLGNPKMNYDELNERLKDYSDKKLSYVTIPEEYEAVMVRLFEQIHARDVAKVDEIFIEILERILKKYPTLPNEEHSANKNDVFTISLLAYDLNRAYLNWLRKMGLEKEDTNSNIDWENSSCLKDNISNFVEAHRLARDIDYYLIGHNTLIFDELNQRLKELKEDFVNQSIN